MTPARTRWGEKRYYSLDYYLKETYGKKLYKIALDGGMTCPNRDGTLGVRRMHLLQRGRLRGLCRKPEPVHCLPVRFRPEASFR